MRDIQMHLGMGQPASTHQNLRAECAAWTDAGLLRRNNEDALAWDAEAALFLVADGMGGCNAGEVASRLAVRTVLSEFRQLPLSLPAREGCAPVLSQPAMRLCTAILKANRAVFEASLQEPEYAGMGTTLVAVLFYGQRAIIASIGDSRVYRYRGGQLEQLTVDHTVLQEQIEFGLLTPEQARLMGGRGLITRALGVEPGLEVDVQEQTLLPGDLYLLCTDGLFDMIADADIGSILAANAGDVQAVARELVAAANRAGGYDNVSVIVVRLV
ncbi:PP2C family protein-serine/threonine phosphatase [Thiobacter aerophilum]|uniref:PP2C family serine/threonine-protein phosphatase n=1 Tax=Thiobacter aerophilum TaxID=3121275 RepID=A0ABV0EBH3_9BURK